MPNEIHDPPPARSFVGRTVSFDLGGRRVVGRVEAQVYVGLTARGAIPDYSLSVRGSSGRLETVSLVESYAIIQDS